MSLNLPKYPKNIKKARLCELIGCLMTFNLKNETFFSHFRGNNSCIVLENSKLHKAINSSTRINFTFLKSIESQFTKWVIFHNNEYFQLSLLYKNISNELKIAHFSGPEHLKAIVLNKIFPEKYIYNLVLPLFIFWLTCQTGQYTHNFRFIKILT